MQHILVGNKIGLIFLLQVDIGVGTETCDFLTAPEMDVDDFLAFSASRLDMSCDLDSVSQISAMDSASQTGSVGLNFENRHHHARPIFSSDSNIHRSLAENTTNERGHQARQARAGQFPYAYIRSKLAVLPEEGQLSRRESMNESKDVNGYLQPTQPRRSKSSGPEVDLKSATQSECGLLHDNDYVPPSGNQYTSLRARKMALRRKRSLSVADLPVKGVNQTRTQKAEESGYDSDVTRKSSPRGSVKNKTDTDYETASSSNRSREDTDSVSSGSDDSGAHAQLKQQKIEHATSTTTQTLKKDKKESPIKKPPRKSKLPEPVSKRGNSTENTEKTPQNGRRFKKNGEDLSSHDSSSGPPSSVNSDNSANNLPSLTSKRFKMLRLKKDVSGELGIIITKKRHPQKGTTGYIIAHVEPGGLVER